MAKTVKKTTKAAKKTAAKKPASKKPAAKTTKKAPAKKVVAKKASTATKKKVAKKTVVKKAPAKKVVAKKKAPVKKSVAPKAKKTTSKKSVAKPANKKPAPKASAKKTISKKTVAKKPAIKKAIAKKTTKTPKKSLTKKAATSKKTAKPTKTAVKKTTSTKKSTTTKTAAEKAPAKASTSKKSTATKGINKEEHIKKVLKKLSGASKNTPTAFRLPSRKNTPILFSMDDMQGVLKQAKVTAQKEEEAVAKQSLADEKEKIEKMEAQLKPRTLKSASLDDLLGGGLSAGRANTQAAKRKMRNEIDVPKKWISYYRALMDMRDRLTMSVEERTEQTKASAKDSSGNLSSYGQHIGDAGTDAYEFDFALSMVSSEQEMLREVDAAIDRIFNGTYGICEQTGKPISRERLKVVPFTRFSKEGQDLHEKTKRRTVQRVGIASDDNDTITSFEDADE